MAVVFENDFRKINRLIDSRYKDRKQLCLIYKSY